MRWEWHKRDPKKLRRYFVWLPLQIKSDGWDSRWVWLETIYREYDKDPTTRAYWKYYTREEAVLAKVIPPIGKAPK